MYEFPTHCRQGEPARWAQEILESGHVSYDGIIKPLVTEPEILEDKFQKISLDVHAQGDPHRTDISEPSTTNPPKKKAKKTLSKEFNPIVTLPTHEEFKPITSESKKNQFHCYTFMKQVTKWKQKQPLVDPFIAKSILQRWHGKLLNGLNRRTDKLKIQSYAPLSLFLQLFWNRGCDQEVGIKKKQKFNY